MTISPLSAARTMCAVKNWSISNLELQKLLYIAQMLKLGRTDGRTPLFAGDFQAWDYGPVQPDVYYRARAFGEKHIPDVFRIADFAAGEDKRLIESVSDRFADYGSFELVEFTHWSEGAWAKHYKPGVRGIVIPRADIAEEYHKRVN